MFIAVRTTTGTEIWRQRTGIATGLACSKEFANSYLAKLDEQIEFEFRADFGIKSGRPHLGDQI